MSSPLELPAFKIDGFTVTEVDDPDFFVFIPIIDQSEFTWSGKPVNQEREEVEPFLWIPRSILKMNGRTFENVEESLPEEQNKVFFPTVLRPVSGKAIIYNDLTLLDRNPAREACQELLEKIQERNITASAGWFGDNPSFESENRYNNQIESNPFLYIHPPQKILTFEKTYTVQIDEDTTSETRAIRVATTGIIDQWKGGDVIFLMTVTSLSEFCISQSDFNGAIQIPFDDFKDYCIEAYNLFKTIYDRVKIIVFVYSNYFTGDGADPFAEEVATFAYENYKAAMTDVEDIVLIDGGLEPYDTDETGDEAFDVALDAAKEAYKAAILEYFPELVEEDP